jgi:broad specificity phosphatase PhoE
LEAEPFRGLLDIDFGSLQGLTFGEASQQYPDVSRAWLEAPHTVQFPGGESLAEVRHRVLAGLDGVLARFPGQSIAMVSHTVANRVLLCAVLGMGNDRFWRLGQDTCAVNVFDVAEDGTCTLLLLNDTSAQVAIEGWGT